MSSNHSKNFSRGVLIGTLVCLLYWYWQKSTQAEDGALALLDRLKVAEDRLRQVAQGAVEEAPEVVSDRIKQVKTAVLTQEPDDLTKVKGIGPVFASRLHDAGVNTFAQLGQLSVAQLADILEISSSRAERIQNEIP